MKKIYIISLTLLILASCTKEPTLGDKLEGVWLVNKVTATDTAKKLFPVPAGPRDSTISFSLRALM